MIDALQIVIKKIARIAAKMGKIAEKFHERFTI